MLGYSYLEIQKAIHHRRQRSYSDENIRRRQRIDDDRCLNRQMRPPDSPPTQVTYPQLPAREWKALEASLGHSGGLLSVLATSPMDSGRLAHAHWPAAHPIVWSFASRRSRSCANLEGPTQLDLTAAIFSPSSKPKTNHPTYFTRSDINSSISQGSRFTRRTSYARFCHHPAQSPSCRPRSCLAVRTDDSDPSSRCPTAPSTTTRRRSI